ncbi:receptor-type tyrosine-protein phosphatase gamma isoform X1 [Lates japonicus]|uniref:protein-tyrosine-phosphatase n=1 Tax=Lates japonicus TaxID=270547 RepID=A0AAD3RKV5_LATJO|nr:receptor-type tyrosine-protein phosphatase gamma isoform X1 [Lates japonicus]
MSIVVALKSTKCMPATHYGVSSLGTRKLKGPEGNPKGKLNERQDPVSLHTQWPDMGVPEYTFPRGFHSSSTGPSAACTADMGPVLVHCSRRAGRRNVTLSLTACCNRSRTKAQSAPDFLKHIRHTTQLHLVQTEEQYVHPSCLMEAILSRETEWCPPGSSTVMSTASSRLNLTGAATRAGEASSGTVPTGTFEPDKEAPEWLSELRYAPQTASKLLQGGRGLGRGGLGAGGWSNSARPSPHLLTLLPRMPHASLRQWPAVPAAHKCISTAQVERDACRRKVSTGADTSTVDAVISGDEIAPAKFVVHFAPDEILSW